MEREYAVSWVTKDGHFMQSTFSHIDDAVKTYRHLMNQNFANVKMWKGVKP